MRVADGDPCHVVVGWGGNGQWRDLPASAGLVECWGDVNTVDPGAGTRSRLAEGELGVVGVGIPPAVDEVELEAEGEGWEDEEAAEEEGSCAWVDSGGGEESSGWGGVEAGSSPLMACMNKRRYWARR